MTFACDDHPECRLMLSVVGNHHKPSAYRGGAAAALRLVGHRGEVHPYDVWCSVHPDMATAELFAAADLAHYGHPTWLTPIESGVLSVLDLRPAILTSGGQPMDPALPDSAVSPARR